MECRKFQDRRHLQRKSAYALASLCVSIKASYSLIQDTKRGFFMPSNRVSDCRASGAIRNEDWPDSLTVKRNKGKKEC